MGMEDHACLLTDSSLRCRVLKNWLLAAFKEEGHLSIYGLHLPVSWLVLPCWVLPHGTFWWGGYKKNRSTQPPRYRSDRWHYMACWSQELAGSPAVVLCRGVQSSWSHQRKETWGKRRGKRRMSWDSGAHLRHSANSVTHSFYEAVPLQRRIEWGWR